MQETAANIVTDETAVSNQKRKRKMNPVKEQKTIFNQAQESMRTEEAASSNGKAETGIMLGLALSSLFTIIYMVVALGGSLLDLGWTEVLAYMIGGLLGLAAIMPGEAAVWIWKTKLQSDYEINGTQVTVAWIAGLASAVSAAISTVSFFAYLLQGLMPGWYDADTAAGVNVANIAVGWAVFGLAVFIYYAAGDSSKRNRNRAKALHVARTAQDQMIAGIAQGTKDKIEELIQGMGENNIFVDDALEQVARAMGLNDERTQQVRNMAKSAPPSQPAPQPRQEVPATRPTPAPRQAQNNGRNGYNYPKRDGDSLE
jgi:hypothetical protein